jgi:hypothetical protein
MFLSLSLAISGEPPLSGTIARPARHGAGGEIPHRAAQLSNETAQPEAPRGIVSNACQATFVLILIF